MAAFTACISTVLTNVSQILLLFCTASTSFAHELTATKQGNLYSLVHDSLDPAYLLLLYPADTKFSALNLQSSTNVHVLSTGVCIHNGSRLCLRFSMQCAKDGIASLGEAHHPCEICSCISCKNKSSYLLSVYRL